jgi:hypothetical protein
MININNLSNTESNLIGAYISKNERIDLFPRFIQLTPEFKIVLNDEPQKMTPQLKQERLMLKMPVSGELEGGIIAYLDPKQFSTNDLNVLTGVFCESVNILTGHFLTRIDQEENLMCSLQFPVIYGVNSQKEHNYDFFTSLENNGVEVQSFELEGSLSSPSKTAKLLIQVFLVQRGAK